MKCRSPYAAALAAAGLLGALVFCRPSGAGSRSGTRQLAGVLEPRMARAGTRYRTATKKLRQMIAALALERRWSKPQIVEAYLNMVTYRGEIEGIGAASRIMFGKAPQGI